jgi:NADPH:quinone reductase-like Zn-dependent oxidoreductase
MANHREFRRIARLVEGRRIDPLIDVEFPFEETPAALDRLAAGDQFGKIVIRIAATD